MFTLTDDAYTLQREVKKAYLLRRKGLLTDDQFVDVVDWWLQRTTSFTDREREDT